MSKDKIRLGLTSLKVKYKDQRVGLLALMLTQSPSSIRLRRWIIRIFIMREESITVLFLFMRGPNCALPDTLMQRPSGMKEAMFVL